MRVAVAVAEGHRKVNSSGQENKHLYPSPSAHGSVVQVTGLGGPGQLPLQAVLVDMRENTGLLRMKGKEHTQP